MSSTQRIFVQTVRVLLSSTKVWNSSSLLKQSPGVKYEVNGAWDCTHWLYAWTLSVRTAAGQPPSPITHSHCTASSQAYHRSSSASALVNRNAAYAVATNIRYITVSTLSLISGTMVYRFDPVAFRVQQKRRVVAGVVLASARLTVVSATRIQSGGVKRIYVVCRGRAKTPVAPGTRQWFLRLEYAQRSPSRRRASSRTSRFPKSSANGSNGLGLSGGMGHLNPQIENLSGFRHFTCLRGYLFTNRFRQFLSRSKSLSESQLTP